jgi:catalase
VKLKDSGEAYVGGSETKEVAVLQSLVKNLGGLMTATYLADTSNGLNGLSFPNSERRVLRDAHPKGLLCLRGQFETQENALFAEGFLGEKASYPALVRFSSSAPSVQPDKVRDIRGFAVKVQTQAAGPNNAHDFVNLSSPTFPTNTSGEFLDLVKITRIAKCGQDPRGFAACATETGVPNPFNLAVAAARFLATTNGEPQTSLLEKTFFGVTPYRFRTEEASLYFKFHFKPEACVSNARREMVSVSILENSDFLADNVRDVLKSRPVCYGLYGVTLAKSDDLSVLEQHTKTWEEAGLANSPVRIATLRFDQNAEELDALSCDQQTFSPDNVSQGFQALGSLNRARGIVYEKLAQFRKRLNQEIEDQGL